MKTLELTGDQMDLIIESLYERIDDLSGGLLGSRCSGEVNKMRELLDYLESL